MPSSAALEGSVWSAESASNSLENGAYEPLQKRFEQRFLVGEVQIECALRDTGLLRDIIEPRSSKAVLGKHIEGRSEDCRAALIL